MENYVGKRLDGRYEIMEVIGVGGMAVVYKAFDNIDHRIVAVKILKSEYLANEEFKRRFRNESKAVAVLSHPNIVRVYDVSFGDAIQYIVMEYVEGITLKNYITQQGVVDPREALYFITQLLRALKHAHDKGIVHRDIKPQNILLVSDGTIKVTDFGIARISENATRTMTDGAIGSVHYISPEQAKGSHTDSRTDLYAAGVILYEMMTGKLPFQSDNAVSVALMQLQNDPIRPREINSNIAEGLEEIIIHAMQKNPAERYQTANEMLSDITAYKNNPEIVFGYDMPKAIVPENEDATIFVPESPVVTEPEVTETVDDTELDETDLDDKKKKKTIAILSSVLAALIVFAATLIIMFAPDSEKIDVPDLIGLNFYTDVMNQSKYADYSFEPIIDHESDEESGIIIGQEPSSGKIKSDAIIVVYISGSNSKVEIPDVYGYEATSASNVLKRNGFDVKIEREYSEEEVGTVIRTSPAKNKKVEKGSVVTIYVATNEEIEPVAVPTLLGLTIAQAKERLEEVGLFLDSSRTEYRSSAEPVGKIIGHEFIGEEVKPGTSIAVYVSTGKVPEETTDEESTGDTTTEKEEESTTKTTTTKPTTTKPTTTKPTTTKPTTTRHQTTEPTEVTDNITEPTEQTTVESETTTTTEPSTQATEVVKPTVEMTDATVGGDDEFDDYDD